MSSALRALELYPQPDRILVARIDCEHERRYAVSISPAGTPSSRVSPQPSDIYFRFALHYYARVLYDLASRRQSTAYLREIMTRIAEGTIARSSDLFEIAQVGATLTGETGYRVATATLSFRRHGLRSYAVDGDLTALPLTQLSMSVVAVCQALLANLSQSNIDALPLALANMNVSYDITHALTDPQSQYEVPAVAYHAIAFE
ncbi:MAG TPA: hypothetical protein VNA69_04920 [Thermoanaerobaculia bacterium]|nr:hypothetical protein [Thermoanaerobaculia bacterium]